MIRTTTPGGAVATRTSRLGAWVAPKLGHSRFHNRRFLLALLASLALLACDSETIIAPMRTVVTTASLSDAELRLVAGDAQAGEVGSFLSAPLIVEVTDTSGIPMPNVPVEWTFSEGGGVHAVGQGSPTDTIRVSTDTNGRATMAWQLGTGAGMQSALVRIVDPEGTPAASGAPSAAPGNGRTRRIRFQASGKPAGPDIVDISPDDPTLVQGTTIQLVAIVRDRYGNSLDSASVSWSSSNETVAQVTAAGTLRAVGPGLASVTAQSGRADASVLVTSAAPTNQAPSAAIASPSQNVTITLGAAVSFQGTASDTDGTVASHTWTFGDGSTASVEDPGAYTYSSAGAFDVTYQVTDNQGTTSPIVRRAITVVAPGNQAPTAAISSPSQNVTITLGAAVTLQGTAGDADGTIAAHSWAFGDGNTSSVEDPGAHTYTSAGTFAVTYQVTDNQGTTSPIIRRTITVVAPANQAPTAAIAGPSQNVTVTLGVAVSFQGTASDTDGTVVSHRWAFGDGNTASVEDPGAHTYASAGTFGVTYQVTDNQDTTSPTARRTITVVDSSPPPPPPPPPPGFAVLFHSDWSTATGTSNSALLDTSKAKPWDSTKGDGNGGASVSDAVSWPDGITRALTIKHISGNDNPGVRLSESLPAWRAGERRYWRMYIEVVAPSTPRCWASLGDDSSHPVQDGAGGSNTNWEFDIELTTCGRWRPQFESYGNGTWGINGFPGGQLDRNEVYRLEWGFERNGSNQIDFLGARIYDSSGTLLYREGDFSNRDSEAATVVRFQNMNQPSSVGDQQLGTNGWGGGSTSSPYAVWHYAAFAICQGDWCGRYREGI